MKEGLLLDAAVEFVDVAVNLAALTDVAFILVRLGIDESLPA